MMSEAELVMSLSLEPMAMLAADGNHQLLHANVAFIAEFELDLEERECMGLPIAAIVPQLDLDPILRKVVDGQASSPRSLVESAHRTTKDGKSFLVMARLSARMPGLPLKIALSLHNQSAVDRWRGGHGPTVAGTFKPRLATTANDSSSTSSDNQRHGYGHGSGTSSSPVLQRAAAEDSRRGGTGSSHRTTTAGAAAATGLDRAGYSVQTGVHAYSCK